MQIELDQEDFEKLLLMAAFALGHAVKQNDERLMRIFLQVANKINTHNPDWKQYEIPEAEKL